LVPIFNGFERSQKIGLDPFGFLLKISLNHFVAWLTAIQLSVGLRQRVEREQGGREGQTEATKPGCGDCIRGKSDKLFQAVHGAGGNLVRILTRFNEMKQVFDLLDQHARAGGVLANGATKWIARWPV